LNILTTNKGKTGKSLPDDIVYSEEKLASLVSTSEGQALSRTGIWNSDSSFLSVSGEGSTRSSNFLAIKSERKNFY
jgi:hypothetical protein